jgi:tetratricopeptide (TPR) repeat protein
VESNDRTLAAACATVVLAAELLGPTPSEEAFRTMDEVGPALEQSRLFEAVVLTTRAGHRAMQGAFDEARASMADAIAIAESLGLSFPVAAANQLWGRIEWWAGDLAAAERHHRIEYDIELELGDEGHASTSAGNLARVLCLLGRYDEAEPLAAAARRTAAHDDLASQTIGLGAQGLLASARGEHEDAERLARRAVEMFDEVGAEMPMSLGDAWLDLAAVRRAAGSSTAAAEAARRALEQYEIKGIRSMIERTRTLLAELRAAR